MHYFSENPHFSYRAGLVKTEQKDYEKAEALFNKALAKNPQNKDYQEALGLSLFFQKSTSFSYFKNLNTAQSYFYTGILYYLSKTTLWLFNF